MGAEESEVGEVGGEAIMKEEQADTRSVELGVSAPSQPPAEREVAMSNGRSHTFMAFLAGLTTGGIAALLLASTSGRELREQIGDETDKLRTTAFDKAREAREKVTESYEEATERAVQMATAAQKSAEAYREAVKEAVKKGKAAYDRELARAK